MESTVPQTMELAGITTHDDPLGKDPLLFTWSREEKVGHSHRTVWYAGSMDIGSRWAF